MRCYVVAKLAESFDAQLYGLGHAVSGHTLKHLAAAAGAFLACRIWPTARSAEALTLAIASGRLRRSGLELPSESSLPSERELALYALLVARGEEDPYARYDGLRRELDSFLEALEARSRRQGIGRGSR